MYSDIVKQMGNIATFYSIQKFKLNFALVLIKFVVQLINSFEDLTGSYSKHGIQLAYSMLITQVQKFVTSVHQWILYTHKLVSFPFITEEYAVLL